MAASALTEERRLRDSTVDEDGVVWNASLVLANHLRLQGTSSWRGRRVLELGAGLGTLSLTLARLGASVVATDAVSMMPALRAGVARRLAAEGPVSGSIELLVSLFTQSPYVLGACTILDPTAGAVGATINRTAQPNCPVPVGVAATGLTHGAVDARLLKKIKGLDWGEKGWKSSQAAITDHGPYDVVVLAELYGFNEFHEDLLYTLEAVYDSQPDSPLEAWSIFKNRPFSMMFMAMLWDTGRFKVEQVEDFDDLGMENDVGDEIFLHRFFLKP